jgi:transposase
MNLQEQKIKRLSEEEIKNLSNDELMEYLEEQSKIPRNKRHTQKEVAEILGIGERSIRRSLSDYRNKGGKTIEKEPIFTEEEIKALEEIVKEMIKEHENNFFQSNDFDLKEYQIYEDLKKVQTNPQHVRSAFNMSKETTEQLKKFSQIRRIPLQDLVELAVIKLLEEYDR